MSGKDRSHPLGSGLIWQYIYIYMYLQNWALIYKQILTSGEECTDMLAAVVSPCLPPPLHSRLLPWEALQCFLTA